MRTINCLALLCPLALSLPYAALAQTGDMHSVDTTVPNETTQQPGMASDPSMLPPASNSYDDALLNRDQQPGTSGDMSASTPPASTATATEVGTPGLRNEVVGIKPQAGMMNLRGANDEILNRATAGFTLDMNAASLVSGRSADQSRNNLFVGPSTGAFFSHIGGSGGNVFGSTNAGATGDAGSNVMLFPADLKLGWTFGEFRVSGHGGGNVIYRSNAQAVALGTSSDASGSAWKMQPNLGADLEYGLTRGFGLIARPDWTISGSNRIFTATLGASFPLG